MSRRFTVRAQSALWILPLFLVLSWVSAWTSYRTIEAELVWSFQEEAKSLAVAIGELVDRDELARLVAGEEEAPGIAVPVRRLRRWSQLHRLSIYDPHARLVASYGGLQSDGVERSELSAAQRSLLMQRQSEPVWVEDIRAYIPPGPVARLVRVVRERIGGAPDRRPEDRGEERRVEVGTGDPEGLLLSAYAPVKRRTESGVEAGCAVPDGELIGFVRVETHVETFAERAAAFQGRMVTKVLVSFLLGLLLVVLLTRLVVPKLRQLTETVEQVGAGSYGEALESGSVREINDLANTFSTMVSVLRETVDKGRRSVMDREESRAAGQIARSWARRHLPAVSASAGGLELAGTLGPEAPLGSFVGLVERRGEGRQGGAGSAGFMAVLGRVEAVDEVRAAALATSVPAFLEEHAESLAPEELLAELRSGFEVARATLVVAGGDGPAVCLTLAADGAIASRELSQGELERTGVLLQEGTELPEEETVAALTRWLGPRDADALLTHLQRLLKAARRGGALFLRARESAAASAD